MCAHLHWYVCNMFENNGYISGFIKSLVRANACEQIVCQKCDLSIDLIYERKCVHVSRFVHWLLTTAAVAIAATVSVSFYHTTRINK